MRHFLIFILILLPITCVFSYEVIWEKNRIVRKVELGSDNAQLLESPKVNLNTADKSSLMTLSGIGPKKAEEIIAYRMLHGPFKSFKDLTKVRGMTKKVLQKIMEKNKDILTLKE